MIFFRNVLRAPARSLMTVLGVAAGIALFVAITAITLDLRQQIEGATSTYNFDVVVFERRASSPLASRISPAQMQDLQQTYGAALLPMVMGTRNETWSSYALVIGVTQDFLKQIALTSGAAYADGVGAALIGEIAAVKLGVHAGQTIFIDGRNLLISGIYRTGSRMLDGGVMTDIAGAQRMLTREGAEPQFTLALLRGTRQEAAEPLIKRINESYPLLKAIPGTEFAGALRLMRVVEAFVTTISIVALVGTCLVVSNTLMMAIAERTREIGILMTVGWQPSLVLRMLFAESLLLCTLGTLLGNVFALVLLRVLNGLESVGFGWIPTRFAWSLAAGSLGMALSIALVSLVWPTVVLYRMQPLAALRHE
jgi:putative ABC transport system permease protein